MPNFNGDVVFIDSSGQVRAQSGDLTLRADSTNTRSIIVGSGASLRPDKHLAIDLGEDNLRWFRTYTGHLAATSGYLGPDPLSLTPFPYMIWDNGGFTVAGDFPITKLFTFNQLDILVVGGSLNLIGGADIVVDGTATFNGGVDTTTVNCSAVRTPFDNGENPGASIGTNTERFNAMYAGSGVFNHLAPPTSGTFIVVEDADLLPIVDARRAIGATNRRWARIHASSGLIDSIATTAINATFATIGDATIGGANFIGPGLVTLGGGTLFTNAGVGFPDAAVPLGLPTFRFSSMHMISGYMDAITPSVTGTSIDMVGSFLPDITSIRSLGTSAREWMSIYANSGIFDNIDARIVNVTNELYATATFIDGSLTFINPGLEIISENLSWNLLNTAISFYNGGVTFDIPTNTAEYSTFRPKIGSTDLVTRKEAVTVVHGLVTANSGAIINNSGERDIYNYTVPANTLQPSGRLKLELAGSLTNMAGANVNVTPRVYINGTAIWGDVLAVAQGPRPADFQMQVLIDSLGHVNSQRVHGQLLLATRAAGSVTGNGDFSATYAGGPWSSDVTSGTVSFAQPVNIRVSMQLGTASTNASYSGFHAMMTHYPWPGI